MQIGTKKLSLSNFTEQFKKTQQQKHLESALVYLKLRSVQCPKQKALLFARKKEKCIDGTVSKDGPAGFKTLIPQKPSRNLVNGWLKNQKLKYKNLRGYSEEIKRNVTKEKQQITKFNRKQRKDMEQERIKMKIQNQGFIVTNQKKTFMNQLANIKDQFLKDRQKRNLFLSYKGHRLDQCTQEFFNKIQDVNSEGLVVKLGAFNTGLDDENLKIETDWDIAKGRSLSSYQKAGTNTRKQIFDFRKTLDNINPKKDESDERFRKTIHRQNKILLSGKGSKKFSKQKKVEVEREQKKFYDNLDKVLIMNKNYKSHDEFQKVN